MCGCLFPKLPPPHRFWKPSPTVAQFIKASIPQWRGRSFFIGRNNLVGDRVSDRAQEVSLSRKQPKSRARVRRLRSKPKKAKERAGPVHDARAELEAKLSEVLDQQAASSAVLGALSSPGELAAVFQSVLENSTR